MIKTKKQYYYKNMPEKERQNIVLHNYVKYKIPKPIIISRFSCMVINKLLSPIRSFYYVIKI